VKPWRLLQKLDQDNGVGVLNSGNDCWRGFTKAIMPISEAALSVPRAQN
jgi:hypothetical protein